MTSGNASNAQSAVQTIWCELLVGTLVDAGISLVVISPGSRSTPLVTALVSEAARRASDRASMPSDHRSLALVTIIDERAAAFYALGAARATNEPVALLCTSGTAGAHYLPALIEAHLSHVPLLAITADRPPELLECGASQTIDQIDMFGRFVRQSFDLGAPVATPIALRALRRKIAQAITLSRGPIAGPVHLEVPLRKPLEPIVPTTDDDRALATVARSLRGSLSIAPPRLAPDASALAELAAAITAEPDGVIVVGAMPTAFASPSSNTYGPGASTSARDYLIALARRAGYPIIAESGSQLRIRDERAIANMSSTANTSGTSNMSSTATSSTASRTSSASRMTATTAAFVDHVDLIPVSRRPAPRLVIQLGAEPVAASWPHWDLSRARRWVLATTWADPTSTARVIPGDVALSLELLVAQIADRSAPTASFAHPDLVDAPIDRHGARTDNIAELDSERMRFATSAVTRGSQQRIRTSAWLDTWRDLDRRAATAIERVLADHPRSEGAAIRAAIDELCAGAIVQVGNSLPIRVIDQVASSQLVRALDDATGDASPRVITQRGAAGIDGLIASAAGATHAGRPVLLVLGDVSFAHDVGGLLAARSAKAPLAILVIDNRGGQIFAGLPVAKAGIDASVVAEHWLTAPDLDPAAVATAMGARAITAASPAAIGSAIADAFAMPGVTVIHAPVSATGAHDVRRFAIALMEESHDQPQPTRPHDLERSTYVDATRGL